MSKTDSRALPRSIWTLLSATFCLIVNVAHAELPSVKLQSGTLVSARNWWTSDSTATVHTTGVAGPSTPPAIVELSNALSAGGAYAGAAYATTFYEYVRNNTAIKFRFGLSKSARGALFDQSGAAFDQAGLIVALFAYGNVSLNQDIRSIRPAVWFTDESSPQIL